MSKREQIRQFVLERDNYIIYNRYSQLVEKLKVHHKLTRQAS
jgi:hypothetical protein